jgi:ribosomal protein S14
MVRSLLSSVDIEVSNQAPLQLSRRCHRTGRDHRVTTLIIALARWLIRFRNTNFSIQGRGGRDDYNVRVHSGLDGNHRHEGRFYLGVRHAAGRSHRAEPKEAAGDERAR